MSRSETDGGGEHLQIEEQMPAMPGELALASKEAHSTTNTANGWSTDPANPRNWSLTRKAASTAVVSGIGFVRYAPSLDEAYHHLLRLALFGGYQVATLIGIFDSVHTRKTLVQN